MKTVGASIGGLIGILFGLVGIVSGIGLLFFTDSYFRFIAEHVIPFMSLIGAVGLGASIFLGLPFLIWRKTSGWAEVIFAISGLIVGFGISLWSLLLIYVAWGKFWTLVVLFFLPITPIIAAVAQGFDGQWTIVGGLLVNAVVWILLIVGTSFAASRRR